MGGFGWSELLTAFCVGVTSGICWSQFCQWYGEHRQKMLVQKQKSEWYDEDRRKEGK